MSLDEAKFRNNALSLTGEECQWCGVQDGAEIHRFGLGLNDWMYRHEMVSLDGREIVTVKLQLIHTEGKFKSYKNGVDKLIALCQRCKINYYRDADTNQKGTG